MKPQRQSASYIRLWQFFARVAAKLSLTWTRLATGAAAVLVVAFAYHVFFGQDGLFLYAQKRHAARDYGRQIQQLQMENDRLKSHVDELQNDPSAIERQAREDLHYTRPGEVIVTLPQSPAPAPAQK